MMARTINSVLTGWASRSKFLSVWRRNGTNLSDGGPMSGATNNNLSIAAVTTGDAGNFTVVVTSGSGNSRFVGLVDDMAVFNRALTPAEIQLGASLSVTPAPPHFDSISRLGNPVQLSFTVSPGRTNVLQGSSNLLNWVDVKVYGPTNGTSTFNVYQ